MQRKCILDGFRQPEYNYQATTYRKCTILDHQISGIGVHIMNTLLPPSYQSAVVIMLNCLLSAFVLSLGLQPLPRLQLLKEIYDNRRNRGRVPREQQNIFIQDARDRHRGPILNIVYFFNVK